MIDTLDPSEHGATPTKKPERFRLPARPGAPMIPPPWEQQDIRERDEIIPLARIASRIGHVQPRENEAPDIQDSMSFAAATHESRRVRHSAGLLST